MRRQKASWSVMATDMARAEAWRRTRVDHYVGTDGIGQIMRLHLRWCDHRRGRRACRGERPPGRDPQHQEREGSAAQALRRAHREAQGGEDHVLRATDRQR